MKDLFAFDPDLVVLAIGENVPALGSEDAKAQFKAGVMKILGCALARRHPLVVVRSSFWPDATKDELLRQAAQEADAIFVDAGPLGREAANAARSERSFSHEGVAGHPGDRGMQALADATQRPVEVSPVVEAPTLGAAFLAGLAIAFSCSATVAAAGLSVLPPVKEWKCSATPSVGTFPCPAGRPPTISRSPTRSCRSGEGTTRTSR